MRFYFSLLKCPISINIFYFLSVVSMIYIEIVLQKSLNKPNGSHYPGKCPHIRAYSNNLIITRPKQCLPQPFHPPTHLHRAKDREKYKHLAQPTSKDKRATRSKIKASPARRSLQAGRAREAKSRTSALLTQPFEIQIIAPASLASRRSCFSGK